jgi:DNA polymerase III subunit gamma/tau
MLHTYLYNNTKVIAFKEGEVEINVNSIADPHFTRTISKLVSKWTDRIWQVYSSTSNIGQTLYEEDLIEQKKEIDRMKEDPEIKEILSLFPDAKIYSITNINNLEEDKKPISETKKIEEK